MPVQKYSRQRESIRENLMNRKDHPTADQVYTDIKKIYPNISLGTVYRNLSAMADRAEIQKFTTGDGVLHFDWTVEPHSHFICRKCGCIVDVFADTSDCMASHALDFSGGVVESCTVNFYGRCTSCLDQETN